MKPRFRTSIAIWKTSKSVLMGPTAFPSFIERDRRKLVLGPERAKAHYELLTPDYRKKLQIMYIHFPVGKNKGDFLSHEGEECGVVLEGRLKAYVGDRTYVLEQGDCIYLDSSVPHKWENIGEIEVRAFWINTPATF